MELLARALGVCVPGHTSSSRAALPPTRDVPPPSSAKPSFPVVRRAVHVQLLGTCICQLLLERLYLHSAFSRSMWRSLEVAPSPEQGCWPCLSLNPLKTPWLCNQICPPCSSLTTLKSKCCTSQSAESHPPRTPYPIYRHIHAVAAHTCIFFEGVLTPSSAPRFPRIDTGVLLAFPYASS